MCRWCCWRACTCPRPSSSGSRAWPGFWDRPMIPDLTSFLAGLAPKVAGHGPWPRHILDRQGWLDLLGRMEGSNYPLLGLWGEPGIVHMALRDGAFVAVASLPCPDMRYPAVSPCRPA